MSQSDNMSADFESEWREELISEMRSTAAGDTRNWEALERPSVSGRRRKFGELLRKPLVWGLASLGAYALFYNVAGAWDLGSFVQIFVGITLAGWVAEKLPKEANILLKVEVTSIGRVAVESAGKSLARLEDNPDGYLVGRVREEVANVEDLALRERQLTERIGRERLVAASEIGGLIAERERVEQEMLELAVLLERLVDTEEEALAKGFPAQRMLAEADARTEVKRLNEDA